MNRPTRNTLLGCVLCLVLAGFFACSAKAEEDYGSANFLLPHCHHALSDNSRFDVWDGKCSGIVNAAIYFSKVLPPSIRFCAPDEATNEQVLRVVVNYLDRHPEVLHLDFRALVIKALHEAWPCR
ncbi:hypothetical protein GGQ85_000356 [Nitrobacter vulgaris]|uniref:Rap1a/Tai family immunity protein n=1 Tax=Nitrobacter vulgaris TaxID=29421 RepID=UPI002864F3A1|nr:hypothetical protein [Nitrobacter vulgaris]